MTVRLIGVIEAEQSERRKTIRNDRLVAVAETPVNKSEIKKLEELPKSRLDELEQFFVNYNRVHGRDFKPIGRRGPSAAARLLDAGIKAYEKRS